MADRESRVPSNGSSKISMGTTRWRRRRSCVAAVQFRNGVLLLAVLTRKKTQQFSGSRFHGKKKYSTSPILDEGSHGFRFFFPLQSLAHFSMKRTKRRRIPADQERPEGPDTNGRSIPVGWKSKRIPPVSIDLEHSQVDCRRRCFTSFSSATIGWMARNDQKNEWLIGRMMTTFECYSGWAELIDPSIW